MKSFKYARRISGNFELPNDDEYFQEPNSDEYEFVSKIKKLQGKEHKASVSIQIGFEQRFLCKFALSIGFNRLGERYIDSTDAIQLRNALWSQTPAERALYNVDFYDFFKNREPEESRFLAWPGVHTILLYPIDGRLAAIIYLYGKNKMMVTISNDESLWSTYIEQAEVYVLCPSLDKFSGPISIEDLISHRLGCVEITDLSELDEKRFDPSTLPKITEL